MNPHIPCQKKPLKFTNLGNSPAAKNLFELQTMATPRIITQNFQSLIGIINFSIFNGRSHQQIAPKK